MGGTWAFDLGSRAVLRMHDLRRWVVERFFGWLGRNRRLARDLEATIPSATAFLYAASVTAQTMDCSIGLRFKSDSYLLYRKGLV
jgi:hypothetical protein